MAKSTKNTYKPTIKGNLIPVVRMADGGNVSELNYSDRKAYIESHYAPFITDAQMIFSIYDSGIEYDYKGDRKEVVNSIIESYKSLADYTEITLPQETIYEIKDWELVRKDIDPDTDEVIGETPLKELSADNTYNFSYNGLVDLNWRIYEDEEYERYFYVITPHLGGDIRGNYGDALILQGNNKEELFYRYYEGFISGGASIYLKFKDGSEISFDSEQDSDVFYFRLSEVFEPTGMAQTYLNDFEKFDTWYGDEFLEETIDIYLMRKGIAPKMMAGGSLNDETPLAYIQILGYNEGKHFNLADYSDGQDVIDGIYEWMGELNAEFGGNREEYEVTDYEGFGRDLYDQYMSSNEFGEIIEGYEKYQNSDFHSDIIVAYRNDSGSGNSTLSDVIDEMDNNFFGAYKDLQDFGYEMVQQGVYEPSDYDVYITDTDKRILAGEEADSVVDGMDFDELLDIAQDVKSEYEDEKSELENRIDEIKSEIDDLESLKDSTDDDDNEYDIIVEQVEEKEMLLEEVEYDLEDIESRFESKARAEAQEILYDEIHDKLENDLSSWLEEYGYTDNLQDVSFLSVDYEKIGEELSSDYLIIEYDGEMYFFNNYAKGGRIKATKQKPKNDFYIVENSTKKLVSGYSTKNEALEQRKLLIEEYPSMRFEIYTLGNLEAKTDLDVYAKKDYVELSTLDKIKKVSVDTFRYGKEKVGQANEFLVRNDVKGKIKRGARNVADKTKQGFNWLRNQWNEADFGDGKGKAKFFADGGEIEKLNLTELETKILRYFLSQLDVYQLGYSDTSVDDIANGINVNINSVKGSVGSLAKKGIIYVSNLGEGIGTIVYLQDDYHYLHPEYKDYISKMSDGGGVEIGRTFESENDSLNTFKGYNNYFCIEFNGKVLHSVKTKSQHLKKLNELVDKYNLTEIKQKNSEFDDGGAVSDEIIIKSGNNGNLKVIYHAIKNQRTELNANEVFEQEKIKGKSVFLFVNNQLYDEFIADGDVEKYADGGGVENIKSDLNKYKNSDIRFKLIPNDGSEEEGDENDLSLNYVGDIYTGGLDSDEPFVELGFQVTDEYADGGEFDKPLLKKLFEGNYENNLKESVLVIDNGNGTFQFYDEILGFNGDVKKTKQQAIRNLESYISKNYKVVNKYADGGEIKLSKKQKDEIKEHIADYYYNNELIDNYEEWEMDYMLEDKNGRIILKSGYAENDVMKKIIIYFELNNFSDIDLIDKEIQLYGDTILSDNYGDNDYDSVQDWQKNNFADGGGVGERLVGTFYYDTRKDKAFQIISEDGTDINGFKRKDGVVDIGIQYYDNNKQPLGKIEIIDKGGFEYYVQMGAYKKYQQPYFSNGGGVENAEMPTRERTTITRPTTTPTTTPSKPDKDNPYKPKIKTRPKASKYDFILINK